MIRFGNEETQARRRFVLSCKVMNELDQLAGNCFKGAGYLREPNRGLSQKVVVSVVKED